MTYLQSSSQQITSEREEDADASALEGEIRRGISDTDQTTNIGLTELRAMETAYSALEALGEDGRIRAFKWLAEALSINTFQHPNPGQTVHLGAQHHQITTVEDESQVTPREFLSQKKPESLVERVACLAYYLTRYRGINHFKTVDIVSLNTEAAAHRFGNPSRDVDNADRHNGYLVSAGNGKKQLTVRGEAVVEALPDREAVRSALKDHPHKIRRSVNAAKKTVASNTNVLRAT